MPHHHTQLIPCFLVRGRCSIDIAGRRRVVRFARIVPAANQTAACSAALARIAHDTRGCQPRWEDVSCRWIANQYMWVFEEEDAAALTAQAGPRAEAHA